MRKHRLIALGALGALWLGGLSGCAGRGEARLVNRVVLPLEGVSRVTVSYDAEDVTLTVGYGDALTVREYMTADRFGYHARVSLRDGAIQVSEGGRPFWQRKFSRYVEVELPARYRGELTLTTTDGDIALDGAGLSLAGLRVDTTSGTARVSGAEAERMRLSTTRGTLELEELRGGEIRLETTGGGVSAGGLRGRVTYTATGGEADFRDLYGSGSFRTEQDGGLRVDFAAVEGDVDLYDKNGDISLTLPAGLSFRLEAATREGEITTGFTEDLHPAERGLSGSVGDRAEVLIRAETRNGDIWVGRGEQAKG